MSARERSALNRSHLVSSGCHEAEAVPLTGVRQQAAGSASVQTPETWLIQCLEGVGRERPAAIVEPFRTHLSGHGETLAFAAGGKVNADFELRRLWAANTAIDRLKHGDAASRRYSSFPAGQASAVLQDKFATCADVRLRVVKCRQAQA